MINFKRKITQIKKEYLKFLKNSIILIKKLLIGLNIKEDNRLKKEL